MKLILTLTLCLFAPLFAGCKCPSTVTVQYQGAPDLNPNDAGEPTNLEAWVYLLKARESFDTATWSELFNDAKSVLGDDHLAGAQIGVTKAIAGAEPETAEKTVSAATAGACPKFVGIVGHFEYEDSEGRSKLCVPLAEAGSLLFLFTNYRIETKPD